MGLLDDAIREHLDLKRRRGADPAEIERAEREALGPVRREPIASEEGAEGLEPGLPAEPGLAADNETVPAAAETYGPDFDDEPPQHDEDWDEYEDDEYEDDDKLEPSHPDPGPDASGHAPAPLEVQDGPGAGPAPPEDDLEATRAHQIEPHPDDEEDVLEETPDFLQDTPDHDRLWFEQRPPKDFDFDE